MRRERYGRSGLGAGGSRRRLRVEKADQVANRAVPVIGVAKRKLVVDLIAIASSVAGLRQVTGLLEVVDDLRCRSFGDSDGDGDVSEPQARVGGYACDHVGVIRQKPKMKFVFSEA